MTKKIKKEHNEQNFSNSTDTSLFRNRIMPEFVPTKLAADYLGISENALRIKVCRGEVPTYKLGRSLRFRMTEIANLVVKRER